MSKIADKKFEILHYVASGEYTVNGLAGKLNELTRLVENLPLHLVSNELQCERCESKINTECICSNCLEELR